MQQTKGWRPSWALGRVSISLVVLAFLHLSNKVSAIQQAELAAHAAGAAAAVAPSEVHNAPMLSMGSESSSALESSAALAGDDLIAAESSQSPDAPVIEHKAFTSGQMLRQEPQMAASVAPVFVQGPPQQQQQQPLQQVSPQQQQQAQMFHPQHIQHMQARMAGHPQQVGPQHQKPFNPFMAAALAGNYGPAQQQIAAAAAAAAAAAQGIHHPGNQHVQQHGMQQHGQLIGAHQQHHAAQHPNQQMSHHHMHQPVVQHQAVAPRQPQPQAQPQQVEPNGIAVQESSVRQNVVPAPNFNSMLDSNTIELNDAPQTSVQPIAQASGQHSMVSSGSSVQEGGQWPLQAPDIPKIVNLEVKCEKNLMKVSIEFDKIFNGVIFSKGHFNQGQCVHVSQNSGKQQAYFDISINSCGTQGNTQNGLYGMGGNTGSGTYFENTIVVQYDPNVQEVYDHARKLRCTWHDQYEKAVTFRPFPVDMLDIVRADFAGDNVGCWMQIQVGKGPWASEVAGIVKIGQTMTMVLAIKDEENKFDMLVRNCFAHDGKRGPIELVDKSGCITRPKLMSRFTKIKNFGSSATVLSYAHFQAFKFPDSMEVHFQCTIQICRHQCPEQCSSSGASQLGGETYSESTISGTFNINSQAAQPGAGASPDPLHLRKYGSSARELQRERRDLQHQQWSASNNNGSQAASAGKRLFQVKPMTKTVGLNRVIQVVSTGDLAFALQPSQQQEEATETQQAELGQLTRNDLGQQICMSSYNFVLSLVALTLILLCSCLCAISLYLRQRSLNSAGRANAKLLYPASSSSCSSSSTCSSPRPQSASSKQLYGQPVGSLFDASNYQVAPRH